MPLNHRNIKPKTRKVRPLPNRKKMVIRAHMNKPTAAEEKPMTMAIVVEEPIVESVVEMDVQEQSQPESVVEEVAEEMPEEVVEEKPKRRGRKQKTDNGQIELSDDSAGTN